MAAGGVAGGVPIQGQPGPGDQRTLGRQAFAPRAGFSPGGVSIQDDDLGDWLRYVAEIGRGLPGKPRAAGFQGVRRR